MKNLIVKIEIIDPDKGIIVLQRTSILETFGMSFGVPIFVDKNILFRGFEFKPKITNLEE